MGLGLIFFLERIVKILENTVAPHFHKVSERRLEFKNRTWNEITGCYKLENRGGKKRDFQKHILFLIS